MDKKNIRRKTERIAFSGEAEIHLLDEDKEFSVNIKDISASGVRIIIAGRIVKAGAPLEIKMYINQRCIQCKGTIAWVLPLSPSLGNISIFDAGIEFTEVNPEDLVFLKQLVASQSKDGSNI
jgi:hypothetical protein